MKHHAARRFFLRSPTIALVCVLVCTPTLTSCGKKSSAPTTTATNPDDMEGGSGVRPDDPPMTVGEGEPDAASASDIPLSEGGLGPDTDPDASPIAHPNDGRSVRVWYGTNRARADASDISKGFSNSRDLSTDQLHLGSVICFIPKSRPRGTTGSSWIARKLKGEDDRIKLDAIYESGEGEFYQQLRERIARAPEDERCILVYIHGYKNSFSAAALRAAQLAVDLNVPGLTAFYSWPSRDAVSEYGADEAAVETAERHLVTFLTGMATRTGASEVHVIAHSMGNRLLIRTIQRIASDSTLLGGARFGQIFLAAPDVDLATFKDLAAAYPKLSQRTTLYVSRKDMALEASAWTHSFHRAGYMPPVAMVPGIDTIEVSQIDVSTLGHGYVAEAEPVLFDMSILLRGDDPPTNRPKLLPTVHEEGGTYWQLENRDRR